MTVLSLNVSEDATEVAVTSAPLATVYGQAVTFTATVVDSSPGASVPSGTVTFKDGTKTLGTGTLHTSGGVTTTTFTTATLATGSHSITAVYVDGSKVTKTSVALPFKVSRDATTTVVTASPTATVYGQSVTFTARVTISGPGAGTPTGQVTFKDGTTVLGTGTISTKNGVTTATFSTTKLAVESHSITAVYGGDTDDLTSTSPALSFNVSQNATTVRMALPTAAVYGQSVTSKSRVAVTSPGAGPPLGAATLADDSSVAVVSSSSRQVGSGSLLEDPGQIAVVDTLASTTTAAPRIAGGTGNPPSAGGKCAPAPSDPVLGDLAFLETGAAGSDQPPTSSSGSTPSARATVVVIPARTGLVSPGKIRVAWANNAPDDGALLHAADSTDKLHDLALSSLFVDED